MADDLQVQCDTHDRAVHSPLHRISLDRKVRSSSIEISKPRLMQQQDRELCARVSASLDIPSRSDV